MIADRLDEAVFLSGLYRSEQNIAMRLLDLAAGNPPWGGIDADAAIPWVEGRTGLTLAESQRAAVRLAISSKLLVITGGPRRQDDAGQLHPEDTGGEGLEAGARRADWAGRPSA